MGRSECQRQVGQRDLGVPLQSPLRDSDRADRPVSSREMVQEAHHVRRRGNQQQQNDQDQKRSGSLFDAIQFGSDFVVVGRELTQAKNKDEVIHQFNSLIV